MCESGGAIGRDSRSAYCVGSFGVGEEGGIHGLDEHRFAVLVATLQYAFEGHRDLRMSQQRARALARPERGGAVGVHEDDQVEPSPRYRSGALALGAAKGFEFGFERRPISAVLGLFGADLGIEGFAKGVAGARQSEPEQGAAAG